MFKRTRTAVDPIHVVGEEVEVVDKYLGVHLDNRQGWKCNTEAVYRKRQSRLHFLRKRRSFNVYNKMLQILSAVICWGSRLPKQTEYTDQKQKGRLCSGDHLEPLEVVLEKRMLHKPHHIL